MSNTPELHEYIEKDQEYLLKIKINTNDKDIKSNLASLIFGAILNGKDFLEGADCLAFYKQNYNEEELIEDSKERIFNSIIKDLRLNLDKVTIKDAVPYHKYVKSNVFDLDD